MRNRLRIIEVAAALVLVAARVQAQCAMCGTGTAYAGKTPQQAYATFLEAALVLLVPAVGLFAGAAVLLWKHRHAHAR